MDKKAEKAILLASIEKGKSILNRETDVNIDSIDFSAIIKKAGVSDRNISIITDVEYTHLPLRDVGRKHGISAERARQINNHYLLKIRRAILNKDKPISVQEDRPKTIYSVELSTRAFNLVCHALLDSGYSLETPLSVIAEILPSIKLKGLGLKTRSELIAAFEKEGFTINI